MDSFPQFGEFDRDAERTARFVNERFIMPIAAAYSHSLSDERIANQAVDRAVELALERLTIPLSMDPGGERTRQILQSDAVRALRHRNNEPEIAYRLAELALLSPSRIARSLAERALIASDAPIAKVTLGIRSLFRDISENPTLYSNDGVVELQAAQVLTRFRDHPIIAEKLLDIVLHNSPGAPIAALALAGTKRESAQRAIHAALAVAVSEDSPRSAAERNELWYLPFAARFSTDLDVHRLIARGAGPWKNEENHDRLIYRTFRCASAAALGTLDSSIAREALIESVLDLNQDWFVRRAVASSLQMQMNEDLMLRLVPLIDGDVSDTAWARSMARGESYILGFTTWIWHVAGSPRELHDLRAQVALALMNVAPNRAEGVLREARSVFSSRQNEPACSFFALPDIEKGLVLLREINNSSRASAEI